MSPKKEIGEAGFYRMIELWFLDTQQVILETFLKLISRLGIEKPNLTQQKNTFTNEKKCTTRNKCVSRFARQKSHRTALRDGRPEF